MKFFLIFFLIIFQFSSTIYAEEYDGYEVYELKSEVISASDEEEVYDDYLPYIIQKIKIKILDDRFKNQEYNVVYSLEDGVNSRLPLYEKLKVGDIVYAYGTYENGKLSVEAVAYYDITPWVIILVIIFSLLILIFGRKNGLKALISLALTIFLIFAFLVPAILASKNAIICTIILCSIVIVATFIMISGLSKKTLVAIIGTTSGIFVAGILGLIFSNAMRLTGVNEHARMISTIIPENQEMINFKDVLFSAIMISAMGACMDIGMSISSALCELKQKKPNISQKELMKSGMNIGRDVMGTMANTLILAYVGSAMLCILLYNVNGFDLPTILHQEDISNEVLKSLAGSIGLTCTVPLTATFGGLIIGKSNIKNEEAKTESSKDNEVRFFKG